MSNGLTLRDIFQQQKGGYSRPPRPEGAQPSRNMLLGQPSQTNFGMFGDSPFGAMTVPRAQINQPNLGQLMGMFNMGNFDDIARRTTNPTGPITPEGPTPPIVGEPPIGGGGGWMGGGGFGGGGFGRMPINIAPPPTSYGIGLGSNPLSNPMANWQALLGLGA